MWGNVGRESNTRYIFLHFSHTLTNFPAPSPYFSTPPHFLLPYSPILDPTSKLPKFPPFPHNPYFSKLPQTLYTPPFFLILYPPVLPIVTLSFTPYQNISPFSFIAKLVQQSSALETPCKFYKKDLKLVS